MASDDFFPSDAGFFGYDDSLQVGCLLKTEEKSGFSSGFLGATGNVYGMFLTPNPAE